MIRETKVPAIPDVRDDNIKDVLRAIKATLDVREGSIGDPLDQGVTLRDLVDLNVAQKGGETSTLAGGSLPVLPALPPLVNNYNPATDYATPPSPTGLRTRGGFTNVFLEWDGAPYRNHSTTEIWRSETDNIGTALLIGTTAASVYADAASADTTYFYWIRFVSVANVTGPYNQTSGTQARTAIDVTTALTALSNEIQSSQLFADLGTRISASEAGITSLNKVTATTTSSIQTLTSIVGGHAASIQVTQRTIDGVQAQYSVKIDNNGHVSGFGLSSTTVNSAPTSAFIVRADRFAIAGPNSTSDPLGTLTPSKVPFMVFTSPTVIGGKTYPAGTWMDAAFIASATIDTAQIRDLAADKITAGSLTAAIGVSTGKIYGGVNTAQSFGTTNFGTGFFMGLDSSVYKFYVGTPTQNVKWDGSTLSVAGTVTATAGSIGGIQLFSTSLRSANYVAGSSGFQISSDGTAAFNSVSLRGSINGGAFTTYDWPAAGAGNTGFHLGPSGLLLGNANNGKYFQVSAEGNVYSPQFAIVDGNASFSGTLTANTVNTTNIVGSAITSGYSASSTTSSVSVTISVPAGASSVIVVAYLGDQFTYSGGSGENSFTGVANPSGSLVYNGTTVTTQNGTLVYSVGAPSSGTFVLTINRTTASGTMNMSVLVSKR